MIFYFAYGSNLHHLQMKRRCPNCRFIKKIILHNYKLTFRSKYGAADIEKKMGKKVYGALYLISKIAEKKLDVYEEYPILYKKMDLGKWQGIFLYEHRINFKTRKINLSFIGE